jgi:hypothetical protein
VILLRYLDVCLVLATGPFVLVGGLPALGYVIGAFAWLLTRAGAELAHTRARRARDARVKAGLHVAGMMGRIWLVALAILIARFAVGKDDAIMCAVLELAAFTIYFLMSFVIRESPLQGASTAQGEPSVS